jgi:predicted DCC family thiol-disulfide oxidoreductase YuxK
VGQRILFFDGVCNLCNGVVEFLLRQDPDGDLKFASLQGETSNRLLPHAVRSALNTVVYFQDGQLSFKSRAALAVMRRLPGRWAFLAQVLRMVPSPILDWIYDQVAEARYAIFGQRDQCRIPTENDKDRLLP